MAYIGIVSSADSEQLSPNYIGFQPTVQHPTTAFVVDTFTGNDVQTVFPLSSPKPLTSRALLVSVNGQLLVPVIDYNLDSTGNIEFVNPPVAGTYITVHHLIFPRNEVTTAIRKLDDISDQFDGTTTRFTLTANGVIADIIGQNVLIISIDGVIQEPGIAYTMDGDDIIFSEAPTTVSSFYAVDIGTTGIGTPSDSTIDPYKFITDNDPSTGKVLGINSNGDLSWVTVTGGVGATNLDGLSDVSITTPLAGHVVVYDGSEFINAVLNYNQLTGTPTYATVASSGNYHDLLGIPTIPTDIGDLTDVGNLLTSGSYNDLTDKPTIPATLADLTDTDIINLVNGQALIWNGSNWINDNLTLADLGILDGTNGQLLTTDGNGNFSFTTVTSGGITLSDISVTSVPDSYISLSYDNLTGEITLGYASNFVKTDDLHNVATSGDYNDLTNKPTIPTDVSNLTDTTNLLDHYTDADADARIAAFTGDINATVNGFEIGYRIIPQILFTSSTTIQLSDSGKHYFSTNSSNMTLTIPSNSTVDFPIGASINIVNLGTGEITITQGPGVSLYFAGNPTPGNKVITSYGAGTIQKLAANTWFLVGVGVN